MSAKEAATIASSPRQRPVAMQVRITAPGPDTTRAEIDAHRAARDWAAGKTTAPRQGSGVRHSRHGSAPHPAPLNTGHPLDKALRGRMERYFGCDFADVRVHNDHSAARAATAVNARAYSLGEQLVFNRAEYAPAHVNGQALVAHELAHVIQQRHSGVRDLARESYAERSCTLTANYDIALAFLASRDEAWTPAREQVFSAATRDAIQNTFNASSYRIHPSRASTPGMLWRENACPCHGTGFAPRIAVDVIRGNVTSRHGDWNATVIPNSRGTEYRSGAGTSSDDMGRLDEADVAHERGQTTVVHEFGHSIGLQHPGAGITGIARASRAEYEYSGLDTHGRAVAGSDLMGEGSGLRPFYFERWVQHLNDQYRGCGYAIAEPAAPAPSPEFAP